MSLEPEPSSQLDEWLERRELELGQERNRLGGQVARALRSLLGRFVPGRRKATAQTSIELAETLGRLSEVREVRRALLGLGPNAHIRSRDVPTFVSKNPDYARTVAEETEGPEAP